MWVSLYVKSLTYRFVDLRQAYMYVWNNHVNEYGIKEASLFYKKKLKVITFYITHAWTATQIMPFSPLFLIYVCGYPGCKEKSETT